MASSLLIDPLSYHLERLWLAEARRSVETFFCNAPDELAPCPCCRDVGELVGSSGEGLRFRCVSCGMTFERATRGA
jgi:hypothetical protein